MSKEAIDSEIARLLHKYYQIILTKPLKGTCVTNPC